MKSTYTFALLVFLLVSAAQGWDSAGHEWLASRVCRDFNCGCSTDGGSTAPDAVFRDTLRHHCYDLSWPCPSGNWSCPREDDDCPALAKTDEWIAKGANQTGCDRWYSLSVASHYFFDSKVFWHRVQNEESKCHSGFETEVGKKISQANWRVSRCGVTVSSSDFPAWISEFEDKLKAAGIEPEPSRGIPPVWLIIGAALLAALFAVFRTGPRRPSS